MSSLSSQSCLSLLLDLAFSTSGVELTALLRSLISTTFISNPTLNFFPLYMTVVPPRQAQPQIGKASNSRPNHAAIHSLNGRRGCPRGRAKDGVSPSSSNDAPEWSFAYTKVSIVIQPVTLSSQKTVNASHVCGIPNVELNQGRVVTANAPYAEHRRGSTPGSTNVARVTVHFRTLSQRTRRAMYSRTDIPAIG
jgi:hypothetical protein